MPYIPNSADVDQAVAHADKVNLFENVLDQAILNKRAGTKESPILNGIKLKDVLLSINKDANLSLADRTALHNRIRAIGQRYSSVDVKLLKDISNTIQRPQGVHFFNPNFRTLLETRFPAQENYNESPDATAITFP